MVHVPPFNNDNRTSQTVYSITHITLHKKVMSDHITIICNVHNDTEIKNFFLLLSTCSKVNLRNQKRQKAFYCVIIPQLSSTNKI